MNDPQGDAAVEQYSRANNSRIVLMNKSGVFLARNDRKRQNPIRNPNKKSHDDNVAVIAATQNGAPPNSHYGPPMGNYNPPYLQEPQGPPMGGGPPAPYGTDMPPPGAVPPGAVQYPINPPVMGQDMYPYPPQGYDGQMPVPPNPQHAAAIPSYQPSTKVFLENLPLTATPEDITACLFQYSLNVVQCQMEYDRDPKSSWCYAHINLANSEESSRCVTLAQQSLLEYRGRILTASIDPAYEYSQPPPAMLQAPNMMPNNPVPPAPHDLPIVQGPPHMPPPPLPGNGRGMGGPPMPPDRHFGPNGQHNPHGGPGPGGGGGRGPGPGGNPYGSPNGGPNNHRRGNGRTRYRQKRRHKPY